MPTVFASAPSSGDFATTKSEGSAIVLPASLQESRISRASGDLVFFEQRLADREPERAHEVVRHSAADEQDVRPAREDAQRVDLARDLRAAEDRRERPLGLEEARELADFLLEQQARALLLQPLRHADDRSVRAVRGAEGVVHVDVGQRRELPRRTRDRWPLRRRGSAGSRAGGPRRGRARPPPSRPRDRCSPRRSARACRAAPRAAPRPARARARPSSCPSACRGGTRRRPALPSRAPGAASAASRRCACRRRRGRRRAGR